MWKKIDMECGYRYMRKIKGGTRFYINMPHMICFFKLLVGIPPSHGEPLDIPIRTRALYIS